MNKKMKLLSTITCGLILSSSLAFTNVQAATIAKDNMKTESSIRSIIPIGQKFSLYYNLSNPSVVNEYVSDYISTSVGEGKTPTADGIRNILIENGVNRNIANNISFSLLDLSIKTSERFEFVFPETAFFSTYFNTEEDDVLVLSCGDGTFSLAIGDPSVKNYSIYGILTPQDFVTLKNYEQKNPARDARKPWDWMEKALLDTGIVKDPTMAHKLANSPFMSMAHRESIERAVNLHENFIILIGDDNEHIVLTREPR